jgi:A/G-specific adenine glycosylase
MRVISRVFASDANIKKSKTQRHFRRLAGELLDVERAGDFNQAMMELGATICTPTSPSCKKCPVQSACGANDAGNPEDYPVTPESKPVPHHDVAVGLVFDDDGRILIQRRPEDGLLGGLWEFPGGKAEEGESMDEACARELREEVGIEVEVEAPFYTLSHAYSHFKITLYAFRCRLISGAPTAEEGQPIKWVEVAELDDYAFPRANRKLIEELERRQDEPSLFD